MRYTARYKSTGPVFVNIRSVITRGIVRHCCLYHFLLCLVHRAAVARGSAMCAMARTFAWHCAVTV